MDLDTLSCHNVNACKKHEKDEIARELINLLSTEYTIDSFHLVVAMHGHASINNPTVRIVN